MSKSRLPRPCRARLRRVAASASSSSESAKGAVASGHSAPRSLQPLEDLFVGAPAARVDHRLVGLDGAQVALAVDLEAHAEAQAIDPLAQRAQLVRQPLRQHGHAEPRQVDARGAASGLGVEERPPTDVVTDIGDVDLDLDPVSGQRPGAHRVVEVARGHRVDGDRGAAAQIPAAGEIALGDRLGQGVRLGLDLGGEALDDAEEPQHRAIDGAGVLGPAESLEENAARAPPPALDVVDAHRHELALPGLALDLRGADLDDELLPPPERTDVRPAAVGDPHPHHLGGPASRRRG